MSKEITIKVFPDKVADADHINLLIDKQLGKEANNVQTRVLVKRSLDSRGSRPFFILRYHIYFDKSYTPPAPISSRYHQVHGKPPVYIIGAGPAGYFAALHCLEVGIRPIVIERGKDVQARRRDLRAIQQFGTVNPDSNYCFGEGGAGTYSDGKLYTRSQKRGSIIDVLHILVEHGASEDILVDAHPHIGSNKLPQIIARMRETIESYGGEVRFNAKLTDLHTQNNKIIGITVNNEYINATTVILATGHSARDIYALLHQNGIAIEAKPFALGLRIEHKQSFIDQMQYKQKNREENLPASSYALVEQVDNKGVFSFCMCPGGLVVPAATAPGEIVVNGMSLSRRDSPYANSGFVTSIELDELAKHGYTGVFASLQFQSEVEKAMFSAGDGSQKAPTQRVKDFVDGVASVYVNDGSYLPGLFAAPLHSILPHWIYRRLRQGLIQIGKKIPGFVSNEANIIGVESRTSAPVKIPRNPDTLMHITIDGLYPCGEGAGYAGGIISAAMDGQRVVKAIPANIQE